MCETTVASLLVFSPAVFLLLLAIFAFPAENGSNGGNGSAKANDAEKAPARERG
jgi:hypothetical protein